MARPARPIARIVAALREAIPGLRRTAASAADEEAFSAYSARRMTSQCDLALLVSSVFALLWWPTDPWIFRDLPGVVGTFAVLRALIIGLSLLYLVLVHATPLRRYPFAVLIVIAAAILFAIGIGMSGLGAPDRPWLYFTYVFPFVTVSLPLRPGPRVAFTLVLAVANVAGILAVHAEQLRSPYAPMMLSFLLAVILVSVAAGHTLFLALRETFLQSLALARASAEVRDYCDHLEDKVTERTHELRRLLAHLETAREDERASLSRELHDELGQELAAQRYALAFTRRRYEDDPGAIARNLTELEGLQARITATVRGIVTTLRPKVLDDQGLRAALEWLVRQTGERTGLDVRLAVDGDESALTGEQPIAAFRIVQESLTNALRHASPTRIDVGVRITDRALELRVRDDGSGFEPPEAPADSRGGAGLIGMRERAHALGGDLTIDSRPGAGTTIVVEIPLARPAAAPGAAGGGAPAAAGASS
ncbi:MAG TPA: sensor histidine kinase [Kofleriaceae bacterium]|nr:sensor histidine kinase [Kofleriaceae bacterium]